MGMRYTQLWSLWPREGSGSDLYASFTDPYSIGHPSGGAGYILVKVGDRLLEGNMVEVTQYESQSLGGIDCSFCTTAYTVLQAEGACALGWMYTTVMKS